MLLAMFLNLINANLGNRCQTLSFPKATEDSRPGSALVPDPITF